MLTYLFYRTLPSALQNPSQGIKSGETEEDVLYETKAAATDVGDDPLGFGTDLNFQDNPRGCRVNMGSDLIPTAMSCCFFPCLMLCSLVLGKGSPKHRNSWRVQQHQIVLLQANLPGETWPEPALTGHKTKEARHPDAR